VYDLSLPGDATARLLRVELFRKQNGRCHWCRRRCLPASRRKATTPPRPLDATLDHVVPQAEGGPTTPENCVMACFACNQRRGKETKR
jgi:5-methylcytosine-specific restriction endonuclease McrA